MRPPPEVFDLFAVPAAPVPVVGGRGHSVRAGDLVLSPGRDARTADGVNPVLARLAVDLDHARPRSLRLAMPIPARDLRWVVQGWGATRFEPGARPCRDLSILRATGRLLHARLAAAVMTPPPGLAERQDRWARADRVAFGEAPLPEGSADVPEGSADVPEGSADAPGGAAIPDGADQVTADARALATELLAQLGPAGDDAHRPDAHGPRPDAHGPDDPTLGPNQLVHGDLAGNVLLDAAGVPLVIDVAPYWRPALWAEAVTVLDSVLWLGAETAELQEWSTGARRRAMLRAGLFRVLSDRPCDVDASRRALLADAPSAGAPGTLV